jgi:2-oxoglutarate dehydrogenase E1 component
MHQCLIRLVCWEAQFGDFANTAQVIIDQFISSGEAKWGRMSGLVMLLPHGYEGMGPEHSSARLERFLQMCNDDEDVFPNMDHLARTQIERCNLQVVNCSTPANYFHILRRQVHREFRKPLVVFTPKSLLRLPEARSTLADIGPGTRFLRMIPETDPTILLDPKPNPAVKRVVFCQGKVYYDLLKARTEADIKDVAIARVEQISPFPFDLVKRHVDNFPEAEVVWCQEEPRNMGAWTYVDPRMQTSLSNSQFHTAARVKYVGRAPAAATATGDKNLHKEQQKAFITEALH